MLLFEAELCEAEKHFLIIRSGGPQMYLRILSSFMRRHWYEIKFKTESANRRVRTEYATKSSSKFGLNGLVAQPLQRADPA